MFSVYFVTKIVHFDSAFGRIPRKNCWIWGFQTLRKQREVRIACKLRCFRQHLASTSSLARLAATPENSDPAVFSRFSVESRLRVATSTIFLRVLSKNIVRSRRFEFFVLCKTNGNRNSALFTRFSVETPFPDDDFMSQMCPKKISPCKNA